MPKKDMNYSKCVIYKIVCNNLSVTDCYVGHTTNFIQRKSCHKSLTHTNCNYKVYQTIRDNGGWYNWSMIEVEKYPCKDFNEACARERYWYETLKGNLNMLNPSRNKKEYRDETKEKMQKYQKEYHIKNKEYKNKMSKTHYENTKEEINCVCGEILLKKNLKRHLIRAKHQEYLSSLIV